MLERKIRGHLAGLIGSASVRISSPLAEVHLNSESRVAAASLIKIPVMLEVYRQFEKGLLDPDEAVRLDPHTRVGGAGVLAHLSASAVLSLRDLATLMIIVSDNTAANALIDRAGFMQVNDLCAQLGATQTVLGRKLMDTNAARAGHENYTSAEDMLLFLREIWEGSLLSSASREEIIAAMTAQQFNCKLPGMLPAHLSQGLGIAHKTGELPGVEHDVGVFTAAGLRSYVVVLLSKLEHNAHGRHALAAIGNEVAQLMTQGVSAAATDPR